MRIVLLAASLLPACVGAGGPPLPTAAEQALLAADREFARDVAARRLEGWVAAFDEHGSQVDPAGRPVTGHAAIRAYMDAAFADPSFHLEWEPLEARVPEDGGLGFTWGRWTLRTVDAAGKPVEEQGHYVDLWRRQPDGTWKLLFDVGEPD